MKLFINNKVYVQVKDISFIMHMLPNINIECPKSILLKFFNKIYICNDKNKYDFIEFEDIEEINYFKQLDFIISYEDYKNISYEKMNKYIQDIGNELYTLADKYHELSEEEQKKKYDRYNSVLEKKYYKIESIREMYKIKNGELIIDLPKKEKMLQKLLNFKKRKD